MQVKGVTAEGAQIEFVVPDSPELVTVEQYYTAFLTYHLIVASESEQPEDAPPPLSPKQLLGLMINALNPFCPCDLATLGISAESHEAYFELLAKAIELIVYSARDYVPQMPKNEFEFGGQKWYLCREAVNLKEGSGTTFTLSQVARAQHLSDLFSRSVEAKVAKYLEDKITKQGIEQSTAIPLTAARILTAQLALFLRKSPDEEPPTNEEEFEQWHGARMGEMIDAPFSIIVDIRAFFLAGSKASQATEPLKTTSTQPRRPGLILPQTKLKSTIGGKITTPRKG